MVEHIDQYDELTVEEVEDELDALTDSQLEDVLAYEQENDNRVTIEREIEGRLEESGEADDGSAEQADDEADVAGGDDDPEPGEVSEDPERVTVRALSDGYHGGMWFDEPGEREVRYNERIRQAVADDRDLEVVEDV